MKINPDQRAQAIQDNMQTPSELNHLIQRPRAHQTTHVPEKVDGIVIGTLSGLADNGDALVNIDEFGLKKIAAHTLIELNQSQLTQDVALGFQAGNPYRPIILGLLHKPTIVAQPLDETEKPKTLEVTQQGKRIVIEAEQELELRCGEAVVLLTADGHIQLRGGYITSHADATQRIRGGSVQIN